MGSEYKIVAGNGSALCSANGNLVVGVVRDDEPQETFTPNTSTAGLEKKSASYTISKSRDWYIRLYDEPVPENPDEHESETDGPTPIEYYERSVVAKITPSPEEGDDTTYEINGTPSIVGIVGSYGGTSTVDPTKAALFVVLAISANGSNAKAIYDRDDSVWHEHEEVVASFSGITKQKFEFISVPSGDPTAPLAYKNEITGLIYLGGYDGGTCSAKGFYDVTLYLDDIFPPSS